VQQYNPNAFNNNQGRVSNEISDIKSRDLRRLEYSFGLLEEPIVMVRRHVVLLAFDPYRAIILSNRVIMIVPDGADSLLSTFRDAIYTWKGDKRQQQQMSDGGGGPNKKNVVSSSFPFEVHAYETIIVEVIRQITAEYKKGNSIAS
jgi:hypothetical protein